MFHYILSPSNVTYFTICLFSAGSGYGQTWMWVREELATLRDLIELKNNGDDRFRHKMYTDAVRLYGEALKADPDAHRYNRIQYNSIQYSTVHSLKVE